MMKSYKFKLIGLAAALAIASVMPVPMSNSSAYSASSVEYAFDQRYSNAGGFSEGLASIGNGVFIDSSGNVQFEAPSKIGEFTFAGGFFLNGLFNLRYKAPAKYKLDESVDVLIDRDGKILVSPERLMSLFPFKDGIALFTTNQGDTWGAIDQTGKEVIKPQDIFVADGAYSSNNTLRIYKNEKFGYIDLKGKQIVKPQYSDATIFNEGLAGVKKGDKWGFIDKAGKMVIKPQFNYVHVFKNGHAWVSKGMESGVIDMTGKWVKKFPIYYSAVSSDGEIADSDSGLIVFHDTRISSNKVGLIRTNGEVLIAPKYGEIGPFVDGLAYVKKPFERNATGSPLPDQYGFINLSGKEVVKPQYRDVASFSEGFAAVAVMRSRQLLWGYIDAKGNEVIKPQFIEATSFSSGLAVTRKDYESEAFYIKRPR